jgi:hypothetical protein
MGANSNIKADKAAIPKRRIYSPHLPMEFSSGQAGKLLRKSRGILTVLQISLPESFPRGWREEIARWRIQTAVKGVNGFVKAMRWKKESQSKCKIHGDFHSAR